MKNAITGKNRFSLFVSPIPLRPATAFVFVLIGALAFILVGSKADADEIIMTNGDHATGTVTKLDGGKLSLETPYAKTIEIDLGSVKEIRTDGSHEILLSDGTRLQGILQTTPEGLLQVKTESAGTVTIQDLSQLKSINIAPVTYKGDLAAGATLNSGNTDNFNINVNGKFIARSKKQRFTLRGAWNYGEENGGINTRNANGSIKYDYFVTDKVYVYVNSLLEGDTFQDLDLRSTLGGGAGYQLFEDSTKNLSFELGIAYVNINYSTLPDASSASGRWSITGDYVALPGRVVFFHYQEGYFPFEEMAAMFLRTEQGVRLTVVKNFFTNFQVNVDFNNMPAPGKKKVDTKVIFGLGYSFDL